MAKKHRIRVGKHREGLMRTVSRRVKKRDHAARLERAVQEVLEERPELDAAEVEMELDQLMREEE